MKGLNTPASPAPHLAPQGKYLRHCTASLHARGFRSVLTICLQQMAVHPCLNWSFVTYNDSALSSSSNCSTQLYSSNSLTNGISALVLFSPRNWLIPPENLPHVTGLCHIPTKKACSRWPRRRSTLLHNLPPHKQNRICLVRTAYYGTFLRKMPHTPEDNSGNGAATATFFP